MSRYEEYRNKCDRFYELISKLTIDNVNELLNIVEWVGIEYNDPEEAHVMEKYLWRRTLENIDHPLAKKALETNSIEFSRWYA